MKLNNKGFMMAEVIVVSAIILIFLTSIYLSYNKIYATYTTRLSYYDTATLYRLGFYRDYYMKANLFEGMKSNDITEVTALDNPDFNEQVFLVHNDKANLTNELISSLKTRATNQTYKDYLDYLLDAVDLTNDDYVMIMERCYKNNIDDCRYAYLGVPDET